MTRVKTILILSLCLLAQRGMAQAPKWVEKAKQAVFSVVTYDQNDKILNTGNGFFISEDGVALSDYTLFKGAKRAVIVNSEGKQMPVVNIIIEGSHGTNVMNIVQWNVTPLGIRINITTMRAMKEKPKLTTDDSVCEMGNTA